MPDELDKYCDIDQCDVPKERRDALRRFRSRRRMWLSWLDTDQHAIWRTLDALVWRDVAFKALSAFALCNDENALHNPLVREALISGHVAAQVLAIRRLTERTPKERLSLRWLVADLKRHVDLFTRENWVCYNGLPYDYQAALDARFLGNVGKRGRGEVWVPRGGPEDYAASEGHHIMFDKLANIEPTKRRPEDRLPRSLLTTVETWLDDSGADALAKWASTYLAHAGGPNERERIDDDDMVTSKKIADAIMALARATEAISLFVYGGGRARALMPVVQYDQFAKLDKPIIRGVGERNTACGRWHLYSTEWDRCLDGVEDDLVGRVKSGAFPQSSGGPS
jgi:hypothetical protein